MIFYKDFILTNIYQVNRSSQGNAPRINEATGFTGSSKLSAAIPSELRLNTHNKGQQRSTFRDPTNLIAAFQRLTLLLEIDGDEGPAQSLPKKRGYYLNIIA